MPPENDKKEVEERGQVEAQERGEEASAPSRLSIALALLSMGLAILSMFIFAQRPPPLTILGLYIDLNLLHPTIGVALSAILLLSAIILKRLRFRRDQKRAEEDKEEALSVNYTASLDSIKSSIEELKELYRTLSSSVEELKGSIKEVVDKLTTLSSSRGQVREEVSTGQPTEPSVDEEAVRLVSHETNPPASLGAMNTGDLLLDASLIVGSLDSLRKTIETLHRKATRIR